MTQTKEHSSKLTGMLLMIATAFLLCLIMVTGVKADDQILNLSVNNGDFASYTIGGRESVYFKLEYPNDGVMNLQAITKDIGRYSSLSFQTDLAKNYIWKDTTYSNNFDKNLGGSKGIYYLKVYNDSSDAGLVKIKTTFTPFNVNDQRAVSFESPMSIGLNQKIDGALTCSDRNDWYVFQANYKGTYRFSVSHKYYNYNTFYFEILNPNLERMNSSWYRYVSTVNTVTLDPGTYYIHIYGSDYKEAYNNYTFWMTLGDYESGSSSSDSSSGSSSDSSSGSSSGSSPSSSASVKAPVIRAVYNSTNGADIRWKKASGAVGYNVYRFRKAEGTKKVATINGANTLRCYDTGIKDNYGRVYTYYVKARYRVNGKIVESRASAKRVLTRLAPVRITSATNYKSRTVRLNYACTVSNNKANGYQIQYAASQSDLINHTGTYKAITVSGRKRLSRVISGLPKGRTYYFRVRSYVKYTNSATLKQTLTWSQYSDTVAVKINR